MNSIQSQGRFRNPMKPASQDSRKRESQKQSRGFWPILKRIMFERKVDTVPTVDMPVVPISREILNGLPDEGIHLTRLGHSSLLLKIHGDYWLLDPVFSKRASPFSFIGPKRFHQPPLNIAELPPIKGVLISHNHYDHLDKQAVRQLKSKVEHFYVPLGVSRDMQSWGIEPDRISEFDWWQEKTIEGLTLAATPAHHFSGRGLSDRNMSLWCSWVIISGDQRIFFSGDSGYFAGFKQIGERYGPFDLTMVETGAYDHYWPDVHMQPEESLQAHLDLDGKQMMPVHNGTFDLAFHAWYEPLERISQLAMHHGVDLLTPHVGEILTLGAPYSNRLWWQELVASVEVWNDSNTRESAELLPQAD
ncbi:MBL fold metallo-hydrolase [Hahella sp. CCB-MM4]|uniref:MBL fold metallo-hydrolase n=1 Tax=Hahella sp. (strain CCB-MM4) TaxID=1926491 RepID=UPI000B9C3EDF|nr:MBL fold metallo-hydrolase [Hahella sp. CCB-MM4]